MSIINTWGPSVAPQTPAPSRSPRPERRESAPAPQDPRDQANVTLAPAPESAPAPPPPPEAPPKPAHTSPLQQATTVGLTGATARPAKGGVLMMEEPATGHPDHPDPNFVEKYGPWAVVTGASQGIGEEFAKQLAAKGMNLVLVARTGSKLEKLAHHLEETQGVHVRTVAADLSQPDFMHPIKQATKDIDVGMLVNNAGSWEFGSFLDHSPERELQVVRVNVEAPMLLSHEFGNRFAERGKGGILNVGSGAGLHGVPGQANYSATKGYMLNLTESLHHELKPKGVDVTIVNPGPVIGEASSVYDQSKVPMQHLTAGQVVEHSLSSLAGHKTSTIPGWFNRAAMWVSLRLLGRDTNAAIAGYLLDRASH